MCLIEIATELDMSMPQCALCWCSRNPTGSTVITVASRQEQLGENVKTGDFMEAPSVFSS